MHSSFLLVLTVKIWQEKVWSEGVLIFTTVLKHDS